MRKQSRALVLSARIPMARQEVVQLVEILSRRFSQISVVYSGRGFHIHITDAETVFWNRKKRLALVRSLTKKGFVMANGSPAAE